MGSSTTLARHAPGSDERLMVVLPPQITRIQRIQRDPRSKNPSRLLDDAPQPLAMQPLQGCGQRHL